MLLVCRRTSPITFVVLKVCILQKALKPLKKRFKITAMQAASKNLSDSLSEVYEPQWTGQDLLTVQGQNSEMLWADLAHKLSDQVLIPLNTYQGQFPEMRKKIEKRGRKLIDYDKERHNVQTLQTNPNRNEAKYARYAEQKPEFPLILISKKCEFCEN